MKKRYVYRFNPHTLSYERVEATWRDRLKRAATLVLPGVVAGDGAWQDVVILAKMAREPS